jgi:hypothetical protein
MPNHLLDPLLIPEVLPATFARFEGIPHDLLLFLTAPGLRFADCAYFIALVTCIVPAFTAHSFSPDFTTSSTSRKEVRDGGDNTTDLATREMEPQTDPFPSDFPPVFARGATTT